MGCQGVAPLWSSRCDGGTGISACVGLGVPGSAAVQGVGVGSVLVGMQVGLGEGIGRDAGQALLAQPV